MWLNAQCLAQAQRFVYINAAKSRVKMLPSPPPIQQAKVKQNKSIEQDFAYFWNEDSNYMPLICSQP